MSYPTVFGRAVEGVPYHEPRVCLGPAFASSYYLFFLTGTSTPANVYQNGALTTPFSPTGRVNADNFGRFPAIYLDPSVIYKVQLFNSLNVQQKQYDPYYSQLATVGTSSLSAFGFQIAPTGEVTLDAPNTGGGSTGNTLTLKTGALGSEALQVSAPLPGNSALIVNSSATTGANTATFQANNKPGTPPASSFTVALTVAPSGGAYTGGTLTANFTGPTASNYTVQLSTLQDIFGCTLTNGSTAFSCPSTNITGTPTVNLTVTTPVTPAAWLPIFCDGVQYYAPIWHGNNFSPYVANPTALGEIIVGSSVTFGSTGITTVVGGTATPSNWFSPISPNIGAGYWINITKTGGQLSGLAFTVAPNIFATAAPSGGTYTGGTLTANFTGNTASNYTLLLSTGQAITGCTFTNGSTTFTCPSTNITGTPTIVLQVSVQGVWENITANGLTINSNAQATINGTYQLSPSSGGTPVVANGTISLSNNNGVQQPTYYGPTPLVLAGNGTATFNGGGTSNWFLPTTANIGADYWINITQTGGTGGCSFSAASGVWTNITNGGLSIGISGGSGSSFFVTGTYIIASDSGGVNQLAYGTVTLNGGFTPVTRIYTTGTGATETAPAGASNVYMEVLGPGGSGDYVISSGNMSGGGGGSFSSLTIAVTGGNTFTYTVGVGGAAKASIGGGNSGGSSTVNGTVLGGTVSITAGGGYGGLLNGAPQSGGVASGGSVNTTGNSSTGGPTAVGGAGISGTYVTGGAGGTSGASGTTGGNYGAGGGAADSGGPSGAGAGGQIAFHYT